MKTLPLNEPFKVHGGSGWTFTMIDRVGDVAIARKVHPDVRRAAYEVAIVQRHEAYELGGKTIEAGENWPGSEAFGRLAWAPASYADARKKFDELIKTAGEVQ
jgi:hypothetical protein